MKIMADILDSQLGIHHRKAPYFIPFFKQVQGISQQRVQILDLAFQKNIRCLNPRQFVPQKLVCLDTDLGISASSRKNIRFTFPEGTTDIIGNKGE